KWWNHLPEHIDPVMAQIGPFSLRYYGLMYVVAFVLGYLLILHRLKHEEHEYTKETVQNYATWVFLGVLIGARFGYVFFYNFNYFAAHPLKAISPIDFSNGFKYVGFSGMSFHGGAIGVVLCSFYFCRKNKIDFWKFSELVTPVIPLSSTFGRIGNFLNGELYGRVTEVPWGMYFPADPTGRLRHPSQLYEAFFEGLFLFLLFWGLRKKRFFPGFLMGLYLIGYGTARFFVEFVRMPDSQLKFVLGPFTMGQILCICMAMCGVVIIVVRRRKLPLGTE
ncbi:MAG: prolipoprotein diacylglyceryl transferase, partial [Proteobacteria bacterium]|nr:prolipoprotein diacylglyceryl transferase [Pseudomonadota bacterium]